MANKKRSINNKNLIIFLVIAIITGFLMGVLFMLTPLNNFITQSYFVAEAAKKTPWYTSYITCYKNPNSSDNTPPSVKIISPKEGDIIPRGDGKANVRVVAVGSDESELAKSVLYLNDEVKDISPFEPIYNNVPYDFFWGASNPAPNKEYTMKVWLCDSAGNEAFSDPVTVITDSK